jgi:hypothetical protein
METATATEDAIDNMRASRTDPLRSHTQLQHSCRCLHVDTSRRSDGSRSGSAGQDRPQAACTLRAGRHLPHGPGAGIGGEVGDMEALLRRRRGLDRAILALIDRELVAVFGHSGEQVPVFAAEAAEALARREATVADRERRLNAEEIRLREWGERLRHWESELARRDRRVELAAKLAMHRQQTNPKVGRNERCPCGSGLQYKHCHGLAGGAGW